MVFLLATPKVVLPPTILRFPIRSQWVGWDGTIWDLHNGAQGVALLQDVVGLHNPKFDRFLSSQRVIPGHRVRGVKAKARAVIWPLLVHNDSQLGWLSTEKGFWRTIRPEPEFAGTWRIGVGPQIRQLRLTGLFDDDHAYPLDPYLGGWAKYALEMEAAQPFWEGEVVRRVFEIGPASPEDFFDVGGSPPFHIIPGTTFSTAVITNPGDVAAYPTWTLVGPLDTIQVGVGSVTVEVPFNLTTGQVLIIDTDPRNQTATLDGVDASVALGFQNFAAIEPGENRPLTVLASDTGTITCELIPLYYRAF